jgi:hypothetical protein
MGRPAEKPSAGGTVIPLLTAPNSAARGVPLRQMLDTGAAR